jgi:hypothetical protein
LLHWLSEECASRGVRLSELLDQLVIERQAEQPHDPELEALLPF